MNWGNPGLSILSFPILFFPWINRGIPLPPQHIATRKKIQDYPGTGNEGGHPLPSQENKNTGNDSSRWAISR